MPLAPYPPDTSQFSLSLRMQRLKRTRAQREQVVEYRDNPALQDFDELAAGYRSRYSSSRVVPDLSDVNMDGDAI